MKCPHCGIAFHDNWVANWVIRGNQRIPWQYRSAFCPGPKCQKYVIEFAAADEIHPPTDWQMIFPIGANRGPVPPEVPSDISTDYIEACNVLPISSKASAALSRRCLQNILHAHGYIGRDLAREIDALLAEPDTTKAIPTTLRTVVDGIRNFGNFSAHPINDQTTLQIIDVEPAEAEWCLEILEEMFDHFYVKPAQAAARKAALNLKLTQAGKPPAK